jgi:hypothetical protein
VVINLKVYGLGFYNLGIFCIIFYFLSLNPFEICCNISTIEIKLSYVYIFLFLFRA